MSGMVLRFMLGVNAAGDIVDLFEEEARATAIRRRGLAACERLLEELGPTDPPTSGRLDALSEGDGGGVVPGDDPIEPAVARHAQLALELGDGDNQTVSKVHGLNMLRQSVSVNPRTYSLEAHTDHPGGMDRWLKRQNFKDQVEAYRLNQGVTLDAVAKDLEISRSYLTALLYRNTTDPSEEFKAKAAEVFKCEITEFMDNPGASLPGLGEGDLGQLSAAKRAVMNMLFQRVKREDVTDEEAMEYLKDLDYLVSRGKVRKPRFD